MKIEQRPAVSLFSLSATSNRQQTANRQQQQQQQLTDEDSVSQQQTPISSLIVSSEAAASTSKFHRAAIDGYIDMLCDASRRDTNLTSQLDGFTPTLLAAHTGQLEALRILVGRGGDPERTTTSGSSGLHLAAARGHLNCVSFLVNFGVNMWALDNDLHTAKDVAAIEQRKEVLNYLDQMMAKQSALNTKNVQKLKEKAKQSAEKRLKQMRKAQLKAIKQIERDERYLARLSNNRRLLKSAHSISDIRLVCKSSSASAASQPSSSSSIIGSDISTYSSSLISNSPIGSLMAAVSRRSGVAHQQPATVTSSGSTSSSSGSSSSAAAARRFFRPNPTTIATSLTGPANQSLLLSNHQSSSSDESSNHSSLSSSTLSAHFAAAAAKSSVIAAAAADRQHQQQQQQQQKSGAKNNRPKYSELVAIRKLDERPSISAAAAAGSVVAQSMGNNSTTTTTTTSIGSKLTKGLGGVSRKVHLRKFLQIASSTSDLSTTTASNSPPIEAAEKSANKTDSNQTKTMNAACHQRQSSTIKWPPAPTSCLSRALSEPDFNQLDEGQQQQQSAATTNQQQAKQQQHAEIHDPKDVSQHKLLTQCLTQLKMRHEQSSSIPQASGGKHAAETMGHADELLLHQRFNGGANEQLIRPSVIKQQQQQQQQQGAGELPLVGSIDSIGSAGSLVDRNNLRHSNSIVTSSSSSFSSSACSYANSSCKTSVELGPHHNHDRHATETLGDFLQSSGLLDLEEVFSRERIDLEALMLLTEDDMKSLNILLGPRRKLLKAIEDRRLMFKQMLGSGSNPTTNCAGGAKYTMVDTQL